MFHCTTTKSTLFIALLSLATLFLVFQTFGAVAPIGIAIASALAAVFLPGRLKMIKYLSRSEVAESLGVKPGTLNRYKLPEPDAMIGRSRGQLPETIEEWNDNRPGSGNLCTNQSRPEI